VVVRPAVRRFVVAGRAVNFLFFFLTSVYCLLASSPFANEQFLKPHISTWLTNFVVFHTYFYWLAWSVTALTLAPFLNHSAVKPFGWSYLAASAGVGLWLATHHVLPDVDAPDHALALATMALLPPAILAMVDHLSYPFPDVGPVRADIRSLASCAMAAAFCWLVFSAAVPLRLSRGGLSISSAEWMTGAGLAALGHAAAFSGAFLVLALLSTAASASGITPAAEFAVLGAVAAVVGAWLNTRLILAPIAITGASAWLLAAVASSTLVIVWSGVVRHLWTDRDRDTSVVDLWFAPADLRSTSLAACVALLLPVAAFVAIGRLAMFDWDFMFQKLIAIAVAVAAFGLMQRLARTGGRARLTSIVPMAGVALCAATTAGAATLLRRSDPAQSGVYAAADPSLRLARDLIARRDESSVAFYSALRANTGIRTPIAPVEIDLVPKIVPSASAPHIFLILVDSLRPDYLSPYNRAVTFTPSVDAFAHDSVVFERAFSRYGGTGLAVPSIWAAGMLPHKEYVTPFGPMNALAKLLDAFHYRRFITTNHITDALFTRTDDTVDLDRGVPEMRHTLCGTLDELETKLASVPRDDRPVFGHMRALDLHIGNVWSAHAEPGESFPGFHTVYASRVHRMDACLGRFLDYLRRAGLYDDSIVVLAADHGDSLGEGLRWGHGFTVFPEVMRIPLVMHLPREARTAFTADVTRVSFAVDITPTLYALLGQTPVTREPLQGSPLFVRSAGDLTDRRSAPFLVASSYGPSYGLLSENGTRLYIADGINGREYAFDLRGSIAGRPVALTDDQRAASRREVLAQIKAIADRYRFEPRLTP